MRLRLDPRRGLGGASFVDDGSTGGGGMVDDCCCDVDRAGIFSALEVVFSDVALLTSEPKNKCMSEVVLDNDAMGVDRVRSDDAVPVTG